MTMANVSQGSACGLPHGMSAAQRAIDLPEVQQMLRRLAHYNLGIFMPHMHDRQTGEFRFLPEDVVQVESGLEVSFQSTEEITGRTEPFLPVAWVWRDTGSTPSAVCEMILQEESGGSGRADKHKMLRGN